MQAPKSPSASAPRPVRRATALLSLALLLGGCSLVRGSDSLGGPPDRVATDVPVRFEPADPALRIAPADTLAGDGCRSPLLDPRDGTELRMCRAVVQRGDYQVPVGRYGVRAGELLRVECNTGQALGVVRR